jgi:6-phosphogluconolactonase
MWRLALLLLLSLPAQGATENFYIGTYTNPASGSKGIYTAALDTATGALTPPHLVALAKDPTFLALSADKRYLYASGGDAVISFSAAPDGSLRETSRQASGANTCFVSLDRSGDELLAASYDGASVSAYPLAKDGQIGPRSALVPFTGSGPNHERQQCPHPHAIYADPENRFVYVPDLGADRIWILRRGEGHTLTPADPPAAIAAPGVGPRHLAFSPDGHFVYVANELGVSTSVYARNAATGALTPVQTLPNLETTDWPKGTGSAEVVVDPSQRWLYVSTRLTDMLTVFGIGADPAQPLHVVERVPCPVKFPRHFAIDPTGRWMVVAGQTDNRLSTLRLDAPTGKLTPTGQFVAAGNPVCVVFAGP